MSRVVAPATVVGILLGVIQAVAAGQIAPTGSQAAPVEVAMHELAAAAQAPITLRQLARVNRRDATGLAADGPYVYVADRSGSLAVYDVADPFTPREVGAGRTAIGRSPTGVVLDGTMALVPDGQGFVTFFDVSDPLSPVWKSELRVGDTARALDAADGTGVTGAGKDVVVFDYTTVTSPRIVGRLETDVFGPLGIDIAGSVSYSAHHWDRLRIVDISDPARPRPRSAMGGGSGQSVAVNGSIAYLGERLHGAFFIPTPRPPTPGPSPTGPTPTPPPQGTPPPDGGRWTVVDVADADAPRVIRESPGLYGRPIDKVYLAGDLVWLIADPDSGWNSLIVLDASDPQTPMTVALELESSIRYSLNPRDIVTSGNLVIVLSDEDIVILGRESGATWTPTATRTATGTPTPTAPTSTAERWSAYLPLAPGATK